MKRFKHLLSLSVAFVKDDYNAWCQGHYFGNGYLEMMAKQGRNEEYDYLNNKVIKIDLRQTPINPLRYAFEFIPNRLPSWICKWRGNKLVSEDWAGPDSGGMGCSCTRCGESHEVTLY